MNPTVNTAQAHTDAGPTELAARRRIAPKAGQLRGRVLRLIVRCGEDKGLTATEAFDLYTELWGEPKGGLYSISPRLSELERQGYVRKGEVRNDRAAYVATDAAIAWADSEVAA